MNKDFPEWLRQPWPSGDTFTKTKNALRDLGLHTVCQSARCPNMGECWARGTATVMILGNTCTRNCGFCSVPSGRPLGLDPDEPHRVAQAVQRMQLNHAVVTTVVRDDLPDLGSGHIADTIRAIHELNPETTVEILVSDCSRDESLVRTVLDAAPAIFSHNLETVRPLFTQIRDRRFTYEGTLDVLRYARQYAPDTIIKSALMVGHGETREDIRQALSDLVEAGCEVVAIGQYLRPTSKQRPVAEYINPTEFELYERMAYDLGFLFAVAGPFVRSSYRSEEVLTAEFEQERIAANRKRRQLRALTA